MVAVLDEPVAEVETRPRFLQRLGFPEGVAPFKESAFVVLLVAPILTGIYKLWNANWRIPWTYFGDGLQSAAYTKSIIENGWYLYNPRLGAPFQADWRDFPLGGENVHWVALKSIGLVTHNYALTMNLYFLFGFFAIALVSHFVARYLGFSTPVALVIAIAYAFLPYHGFRGVAHLLRSNYFSVPLAVLVIVWMANYATDFFRSRDTRPEWRRGRLVAAIVIGLIMGATDTQNAAFMVSILAVIAVVVAVRDFSWRPIALLAILGAATFGSLVVNDAAFVVARIQRGPNAVVANRPLTDQDQYALRTIELVLPSPGHRILALRHLTETADKGKVVNSESPGTPLGTLGTIGLVFSIGAALAFGLSGWRSRSARASGDSADSSDSSDQHGAAGSMSQFAAQLGIINLAAILIGMIGGFAYLIALVGFTSYRTWNRISIFIAFAALLTTGLLLERLLRFARGRISRRVATVVIAVAVVVLCVGAAIDQITPLDTYNYTSTAVRYKSDDDFYRRLEASVPKGAMMFQLPFLPFPENGAIAQMTDYEDFTGYLHTKNLRWNYGGMKGRPEGDWQKDLSIFDPVATLADLAAVGFQGVVVDRAGFTDQAVAFLAAAAPVAGAPLLHSSDDRFQYLDLSRLRARLQNEVGAGNVARASQIVLGNTIKWTGFSFPEPKCRETVRWATQRKATVTLNNTTGQPLTFDASSALLANPKADRIFVRGPGFKDTLPLDNGTASWKRSITLPPGESEVQFSISGPKYVAPNDPRTLVFALEGYSFGPFDSAVEAWAHRLDPNTGCETSPPGSG